MADPIYDSTALQVGNDANYSTLGDTWDGSPTKVAPSAGVIAQGERPMRQRPAQFQNWLMNQFAQVMKRLRVDIDPFVNELQDLAALTAIPTPSADTLRFVYGYGVYVFHPTASQTPLSPFILVADDATTGRWIRLGNSIANIANGFARMTSLRELPVIASIWPKFVDTNSAAATRTRTVTVPLHNFLVGAQITVSNSDSYPTIDKHATFEPPRRDAGTDNITCQDGAIQFATASGYNTARAACVQICLDPYVHDGARLVSAIMGATAGGGRFSQAVHDDFLSTVTHTAQWGIFRKASLTKGMVALNSGLDFFADLAGNAAAYDAHHTTAYASDQNNIIDRSQFSYFLQIWNEWGLNFRGGYLVEGVTLTFDQISDMRFP